MLIAHVTPGSPADQAGLRVGDVLVFVGGHLIENTDDERAALAERTETSLRLDVVRRGQPMQIQAMLAPRRAETQPQTML